MNKEYIDFANAMAEAHEAHEVGKSHSYMATSYKCPICNRSNLRANVYESGMKYKVDVDCLSCKAEKTFSI